MWRGQRLVWSSSVLVILWLCRLPALSVEFELQGVYEVAREVSVSPDTVRKLRELAARMQPGEASPRITPEVMAAYEQENRTRISGNATFAPEPELKREFTFYVRGKAWLAKCYAPNRPTKTLWEIGSTGDGQIFSSLIGLGSKQGLARNRPLVPHSLDEEGVPILWLFVLGADYLKSVTNQMVWPMHRPYAKADDPALDAREKAFWAMETWNKQPWLKSLAFPGPQGWTNAYYQVVGWTNAGRLWYPRDFYAELRTEPRWTPQGKIIKPTKRWSFTITNALETCTRKDLLPTVYPTMTVSDMRVKQPPAYANNTNGVRKAYQLTEAKWETSMDRAQAKVDGRSRWREWLWPAALVAVAGLGGAVWWLRRKGRAGALPVNSGEPPSSV